MVRILFTDKLVYFEFRNDVVLAWPWPFDLDTWPWPR